MTTAPNLVVAGDRGLSQKLRGTGRFPAVFEAASATELRELSKSGSVRAPAAFMFAPGFDEDIPGTGVVQLANGLAAGGFTVLVHSHFTERGDRFDPRVIAATRPMSVSDLLAALGAAAPAATAPAGYAEQDLHPAPPPEPWDPPQATPAPPAPPAAAPPPAAPPAAPQGPPEQTIGDRPLPEPAAPQAVPAETAETGEPGDERVAPDIPPEYREPSVLHRGSGSVTYRAVHEESGIAVALRVRHDGAEIPPDELAALERASRDDHAVTLLDAGRTPAGHPYTASVYCPSGAYAPAPPLPLHDAVGIAVAAGRGLHALHEEGLVHGDVRPGRIMRGAEGPLLTGAATLRGLAPHPAPGLLEPVDPDRVATAFAAPEVLRGSATVASDVYGLGATLWGLLAGHGPFVAADRTAVREGAADEAVPPVPRGDVPEWLANVIARAMASEPGDRYPSAQDLVGALEEGLRDAPAPFAEATRVDAPPAAPAPPIEVFEAPVPHAETTTQLSPPGVPAPPTDWEGLTGWSWDDTAPDPGDTRGPGEAAFPATAPSMAPRPRGGGLRKPLLAALAVLVIGGVGVGGAALLAGGGEPADPRPQARASSPAPAASPERTARPASPQAKPTRKPSSPPTAVRPAKQYVPGQVRIVDGRVSIEVTWADRSGGRAAYYVVGGPAGHTPSTLASAPPGTAKVMVTALNPSVDYCLTVVAVVDVDRVAHAEPVCTHRVKRGG
ncbi:serine/threonine protein kinase [Actinomadura sp. 21ATH]|uniref:serine/threonine protein kinase n=1 Tax=Actinomadura sp. 21ATH TaxID=1735444 RepID=UPI0035C0A7E0